MTTFSNYALEWEETAITNIGLDFGVLNNRLNGTIEVYDKNGWNLISPDASGISEPIYFSAPESGRC